VAIFFNISLVSWDFVFPCVGLSIYIGEAIFMPLLLAADMIAGF